jgi:hypothetical protein
MSFVIFVSFPKKLKFNLCVFSISYKYKYMLFYLNILRLFQEIKIFFSFETKLVFN